MTPWEIRDKLLGSQLFERVSVESSVVSRSPYPYVHGFLTEDLEDGAYFVVSNGKEVGLEGFFVGYYMDLEAEGFIELVAAEEILPEIRRVLEKVAS